MLETKADSVEVPEYLNTKLESIIELAKRHCFKSGKISDYEDKKSLYDFTWCLSVMQQLKVVHTCKVKSDGWIVFLSFVKFGLCTR